MTQTILTDLPDGQAQVLSVASVPGGCPRSAGCLSLAARPIENARACWCRATGAVRASSSGARVASRAARAGCWPSSAATWIQAPARGLPGGGRWAVSWGSRWAGERPRQEH